MSSLLASIVYSPEDKKELTRVMRIFRARQTRRLGYRYEDPDPYEPEYLFYCLDTSRTK